MHLHEGIENASMCANKTLFFRACHLWVKDNGNMF